MLRLAIDDPPRGQLTIRIAPGPRGPELSIAVTAEGWRTPFLVVTPRESSRGFQLNRRRLAPLNRSLTSSPSSLATRDLRSHRPTGPSSVGML
jgi:hypothetical protein